VESYLGGVMLTGKGVWVWKIKNCEGGNFADIVTMCVNAGFTHVVTKIADGTVGYNFTQEDGDMAKALADELKAVGIEPWGYQYIYGQDPVGEAKTANRRIEETGVVGFVINAEQEIRDIVNNDAVINTYMHNLEPGLPWALSSYRYPEVHPKFPWKTFLGWLDPLDDLAMPQVYWMQAHNPAEQLRECLRQYAKITDLPILPTGSAFKEHGWSPTNEEIKEFAGEAKAQGLPGINFWEWAATRAGGFWKTVRDIEFLSEEPVPPPPADCCEELGNRVSINEGLIDAHIQRIEANAGKIEKLLEQSIADGLAIKNLKNDLNLLSEREIMHTREHNKTIGLINSTIEKINENTAKLEMAVRVLGDDNQVMNNRMAVIEKNRKESLKAQVLADEAIKDLQKQIDNLPSNGGTGETNKSLWDIINGWFK